MDKQQERFQQLIRMAQEDNKLDMWLTGNYAILIKDSVVQFACSLAGRRQKFFEDMLRSERTIISAPLALATRFQDLDYHIKLADRI